MSGKKLTLTIGIPTYEGGESLIKTVESVRASQDVDHFRLFVCVDGKPLEPHIEERLLELGTEILKSEVREGQRARIKQMVATASSDILILTQDDIIFSPTTVREFMRVFELHPEITLASGNGQPLPAKTFIERVIHHGLRITNEVTRYWKRGDNYMQCGGKGLAFRLDFLRTLELTEKVMNSDTNFYFLNQKRGGHFIFVRKAIYYFRSPQNLKEHLRQSRKSQEAPKEVKTYLDMELETIQPFPWGWVILMTLKNLMHFPLLTAAYTVIFLYTHVAGRNTYTQPKAFWETDASTKKI